MTAPIATLLEGLECYVGRAPLVVPRSSVRQIIELEISPPPPLARRLIGGVGFRDGRIIVVVSLTAPTGRFGARRVTAVLLATGDEGAGWAIEIASVSAFTRVSPEAPGGDGERRPGNARLPAWISKATTETGKTIGWIDVPAMLREMTGAGANGSA